MTGGRKVYRRNDPSEPGWTFNKAGRVLRMRYEGSDAIRILGSSACWRVVSAV